MATARQASAMTQCSSRPDSCAAPVPITTGATARGSVRRRAAPIQSRTVIGGASTMGRLAGLPLVRTGFRFAVDDLRFEDAATDGSLVVAVTAHLPGLLSLPSS